MDAAEQPTWSKVEEVFLNAADLSTSLREAYLSKACAGDPALRAEVESLLAAEAEGRGALTGAVRSAAEAIGDDDVIGKQLGAWQVERLIGEGGMGSVYLGSRADGQFQMRVAVKILRRGMESASLLARFRHERQILAQLSHPGIAQLLDGGSTPDGRPFLVMEFVDGQPLDQWCRNNRPDVAARCRLFIGICDAVAYAHRNLVVHRDLKPSNILVAADGKPRLLDFGIARMLSPDAAESGVTVTAMAERPMSPDYASPEQILGLRVTTSSDVYSLGAVLFQLLTGAKPHRLQTYTPDEIRRVATEALTERPSVAILRDAEAAVHAREIVGDLDNIVLMAMRKEPERRYASVDELRQDVERYLDRRPVTAREDAFGYRAGKFLRRHRVGVAAAALVLLSVLGGGVTAVYEARIADRHRSIAERERDAARRAQTLAETEHADAERQRDLAQARSTEASAQRARAEQRLGNLVELANQTLLNIHDQLERIPGATEPRKAIVGSTLQYLDSLRAGAQADRELALVIAGGYIKMGDILGAPTAPNLGDTVGAQKSYEKALAIVNPLGPGFDATLRRFTALSRLGSLHQEGGKIAEAEKFYKLALAEARQVPSPFREDPVYLNEIANLYLEYSSLEAKLSDKVGIADAERAVAIREKLVARFPGKEEYSQSLSADYGNLSLLLMTAGRREEARAVTLRTIATREHNVARHPDDVLLKRDLMMGYGRMGDLTGGPFFGRVGGDDAAALKFYEQAVEIAAWLVKADASNELGAADYATALMRAGAVLPPGDEAVRVSIGYLSKAETILAEAYQKNPRIRFVRSNLGLTREYLARRYDLLGRLTEAADYARQALTVAHGMVADEPDYASARINVMRSWDVLIHILARAGNPAALDEAQKALATALDYAAHGPKPERMSLFPAEARTWLGDAYAAAARSGSSTAAWQSARAAYEESREAWKKLMSTAPREVPQRVADLEKKIAVCDGAISAWVR